MRLYPPLAPLAPRATAYQRPAAGVGVSILCRAVSTRGIAVFVPGWSELKKYGGIPELVMGPYPHLLRRNLDSSIAGIFLFSTNLQEKSQRRLAGS